MVIRHSQKVAEPGSKWLTSQGVKTKDYTREYTGNRADEFVHSFAMREATANSMMPCA